MKSAILLFCLIAIRLLGFCQSASAQGVPDVSALTLEAAEKMAVLRNRDIGLALRALDQASADVITAGQKPNPQLSLTTQNINPNRGVGSGDWRGRTVDTIVRVDQLVERGNKPELRVETARRLQDAAGADVTDTARSQIFAVRSAYFDLLASEERLVNAAELARLFGKTIDAANLRQRAGDLAGADVARIAVDAARAQNDARAAEADLARARLVLAYLIGVERDAQNIRSATRWPSIEMAAVSSIDEIVDRRPDVRAAALRVEAANKARELAQALRTRDVSVGVQYEHWPNQADFNNQGTGNSFGLSVSVPLFLRHNYEGDIARAQADWYAARDLLTRARAIASADVMRASADLEAAGERLRRFEGELLPKALKSAESAEFAFRNGAIGVMDLLDARRTLKAIQQDATTARADFAKALAAWRSNYELAPVITQREGMEGMERMRSDK